MCVCTNLDPFITAIINSFIIQYQHTASLVCEQYYNVQEHMGEVMVPEEEGALLFCELKEPQENIEPKHLIGTDYN